MYENPAIVMMIERKRINNKLLNIKRDGKRKRKEKRKRERDSASKESLRRRGIVCSTGSSRGIARG